MHEVDPTVVARARAGDADAFRLLVERHSRYLFGVAHRLTGSAADAEDVVQEAWLQGSPAARAIRSAGRPADLAPPHHRELLDRLHPLQAPPRGSPRSGGFGDRAAQRARGHRAGAAGLPAESGQIQARVEQALGGLTALERAAFILRHMEGQSIRGGRLGARDEDERHQTQHLSRRAEDASGTRALRAAERRALLMRTEPGVGHLDEEALVLHYFGEDKGATREAAERHLATCEACRDELEQIGNALAMVSASAPPEAPDGFERVMWARVSGQLEAARSTGWHAWFTRARLAHGGSGRGACCGGVRCRPMDPRAAGHAAGGGNWSRWHPKRRWCSRRAITWSARR